VFLVKNYNEKEGKVQIVKREEALSPALSKEEILARGKQVKESWEAYSQLVKELAERGDFIEFRSKKTKEQKTLPTKNWFLKLALVFDLSILEPTVVSNAGDRDDTKPYKVRVTVERAGRRVSATGACAPAEFIARGETTRAKSFALQTAETRAMNRAIARFLGLPTISAEELAAEIAVSSTVPEAIETTFIPEEPSIHSSPQPQSQPQPQPQPQSQLNSAPNDKEKEKALIYAEKYQLMEQINSLIGDEEATELAQKRFKVRRLIDLGVPQLRELLSSISAKKEDDGEEIILPTPQQGLL
jgi:hypothetical protein